MKNEYMIIGRMKKICNKQNLSKIKIKIGNK